MLVLPQNGTCLQVGSIYRLPCTQMGCLLKVWEDLAPLLGGDMRMHTAVVAMYILLGDMYGTMFEEGALQVPEVAQAFQRWVCAAIRSPYINWMLHDATVTIQAIRPYGLGMVSGDLLEGSNRVLKDIWSSFCDRGGGQEPWCRAALRCSGRLMSVCSCTLKYQGGMGPPEATCAMH